jgi:putative ABC transport system permease protein
LLSDVKELNGVQEVAKVYYANGFAPIEGNIKDGLINFQRNRILAEKPSLTEQEVEEIIEKTDFSAYGDFINAQVYGFDGYWLDKLKENMIEGTFDREKFLSGDYLLLGFDGEGMVQVGDTVTLSLDDKDGEKRSYKVMGKVDYSALNSLGSHFISMPAFPSIFHPPSLKVVQTPISCRPQLSRMKLLLTDSRQRLGYCLRIIPKWTFALAPIILPR